jgi:hypothetical protein
MKGKIDKDSKMVKVNNKKTDKNKWEIVYKERFYSYFKLLDSTNFKKKKTKK